MSKFPKDEAELVDSSSLNMITVGAICFAEQILCRYGPISYTLLFTFNLMVKERTEIDRSV